jgi:hypothetical protein
VSGRKFQDAQGRPVELAESDVIVSTSTTGASHKAPSSMSLGGLASAASAALGSAISGPKKANADGDTYTRPSIVPIVRNDRTGEVQLGMPKLVSEPMEAADRLAKRDPRAPLTEADVADTWAVTGTVSGPGGVAAALGRRMVSQPGSQGRGKATPLAPGLNLKSITAPNPVAQRAMDKTKKLYQPAASAMANSMAKRAPKEGAKKDASGKSTYQTIDGRDVQGTEAQIASWQGRRSK